MTYQVWKYKLKCPGQTILEIPMRHHLRAVQMQQGELCLWAEVALDVPQIPVTFEVIGTGWDVPERGFWVGTVQAGAYVWHVYREVS
jgi:hypothetical protein